MLVMREISGRRTLIKRSRVAPACPWVRDFHLLSAIQCHLRVVSTLEERFVEVDIERRVQARVDVCA